MRLSSFRARLRADGEILDPKISSRDLKNKEKPLNIEIGYLSDNAPKVNTPGTKRFSGCPPMKNYNRAISYESDLHINSNRS